MKILNTEQIRLADAYTISHEPISSADLMERAASKLFEWFQQKVDKHASIAIFAGPGNNGGDGLALARMLMNDAFTVKLYRLTMGNKCSGDHLLNLDRLKKTNPQIIHEIASIEDIPDKSGADVIVDALFGSGLTRPLEGLPSELLEKMNKQPALKIAVDMPSGLFADKRMTLGNHGIFRADITLSFQLPKLAFFIPEYHPYVGEWVLLDIGLDAGFIQDQQSTYHATTLQEIGPFYRNRSKYSHKGCFGHALLIAGSPGKMGAAVLSGRAVLRSGAGLLTVRVPASGIHILQTALAEAMVSSDPNLNYHSQLTELSTFAAVGAGPGIGQEQQTANMLKLLIQEYRGPMVLDADALNILSENPTWLAFLPKNSILTPHPGEFDRLTGKSSSHFDRLEKLRNLSIKHQLVVVLKGAHTAVAFPNGNIFFNSSGNPGMATAGSGDVLTGIILALLAQGYNSQIAALAGVYLHGLAGDIALEKGSEESLIASDITKHLGKAFTKWRTAKSDRYADLFSR